MEVTKENYKEYFEGLASEIKIIEQCDNNLAKDIVSKLKLELNGKLQGADDLMRDNSVLKIGVVGQVKAGKSSFLNSLFFDGENVLPRASTPMTAGLTVLEYGEENKFVVEYYNTKEWKDFEDRAKEYDSIVESFRSANVGVPETEIIKMADQAIDIAIKTAKELIIRCDRAARSKIKDIAQTDEKSFSNINDLQDILEQYVGADGQFTSMVKCLTIQLHDERLKDLRIVDTPGVNDPVVSREQRTREFLRSCHGVFFLSYSGRFFDSTDVDFLVNRVGSQGVGTVVLIASKFDSVLQDVGMKFENDLEGAITHCQKQLKSQYNTNISTSSFNGKDPILDFSSGIGFSVFKKEENRWDEMERHVVERMKAYFPDFFSTTEDAKDIFYNLSQMDSIREEYLNKVFVKNKDAIIADKISAYFGTMSVELGKIVNQNIEDLSCKLKILNSTDINDIEVKKQVTERAITSIEKGVGSVSERLKSKAVNSLREALNSTRFSAPNIPTRSVTKSFVRTSTFWGRDKSFDATYDEIDVNKLIDSLDGSAASALKSVTSSWKKGVEELKVFMRDSIDKMITEAEQKDSSGQFDADILRNMMYEIIDKMSSQSNLNENSILDEFRNACINSLQGVERFEYYQREFAGEDSEGRSFVRSLAEECKHDARNLVSHLVSSFNSNIEDELKESCEKVTGVVIRSKGEFIDTMKNNCESFLNELMAQLADKQKNAESLEKSITALNNFKRKL